MNPKKYINLLGTLNNMTGLDAAVEKAYQGVAVVDCDCDGQGLCIVPYEQPDKGEFDQDVKDGKLLDGRPVVGSAWFSTSVDLQTLRELSDPVFQRASRRVAEEERSAWDRFYGIPFGSPGYDE